MSTFYRPMPGATEFSDQATTESQTEVGIVISGNTSGYNVLSSGLQASMCSNVA